MSVQLPDRRSAADRPAADPAWQSPDGVPDLPPWTRRQRATAAPDTAQVPPQLLPTAPRGPRPVPVDRGLSIAALVVGLVELLLVVPVVLLAAPVIYPRPGVGAFAVAVLLTAPAVVLSAVALRRLPPAESRGLGVAGLVTGLLAMLVAVGLLALSHATPTLGSTVDTAARTVEDSFDGPTLFDEWTNSRNGSSGRVEDGRMALTTDGDLVVNWVNLTEPPTSVALEATAFPEGAAFAGLGVAQGYDQLYTVTIDPDGELMLMSHDGLLDSVRTGPVGPDGATLTLTVTVGADGTTLTAARTDTDAEQLEARVDERPEIDRLCLVVEHDAVGRATFDDFRATF